MCDLHLKFEEDQTKTVVAIESDRYFGRTDNTQLILHLSLSSTALDRLMDWSELRQLKRDCCTDQVLRAVVCYTVTLLLVMRQLSVIWRTSWLVVFHWDHPKNITSGCWRTFAISCRKVINLDTCYSATYVKVTRKIKLFQPSSKSRLKQFWLKLFQNNFRGLLQLMNIFQHLQCHWNNLKKLEFLKSLKLFLNNFMSHVSKCESITISFSYHEYRCPTFSLH